MQEVVRAKMVEALKSGDKESKGTYSLLVSALTLREKENKNLLTPDQENEVVVKMVKQIRESIDTCPSDRVETLSQYNKELGLISQFMPKQLSEDEIELIIKDTLDELGLATEISAKDKGKIMKVLMPKVKGKADGKLVNEVLAKHFVWGK